MKTRAAVASDPQQLAQLLVERELAGDPDAMAELYEAGAILDCGSGRIAHGRDAIREFYGELIAAGRKFDVGDQRPAIICGDLALTSTRLANGGVTAEIARRQEDGSWRGLSINLRSLNAANARTMTFENRSRR